MTKNAISVDNKRLFFYGCGGVSMSALCKYFLSKNHQVFGFDDKKSEKICELERLGLKFIHPNDLYGGDFLIVYTSAVEKTADFKSLKERGFEFIKRSQLLSIVQENFRCNIAVSGTHGKTTTTSMIAHVLDCAKVHPTAFIGGEDYKFDNLLIGKNKVCVVEACEFRSNFLDMRRDLAIVSNVDCDHLDSYDGMDNLKNAFKEFVKDSVAVINADNENSNELKGKKTITFGINNPADFMAGDIKTFDDKIEFKVYNKGRFKSIITLNVVGIHNVYNALSVIASLRWYGIKWKYIREGLFLFKGVKRRNEKIGIIGDKTSLTDYAHHPTEISAILSTLNLDKTIVVFQPHTYSRTLLLKDDFINVLSNCKNLIIYKTYPAREKYMRSGDARSLYISLVSGCKNNVFYADTPKALKEIIDSINDIKAVLFVGAGDIYEIAVKLTDKK